MGSSANYRSVLGQVRTSYPRLQRLLVPLDFSGKSRQALRYAIPIAQRFGGRIHLVHVLPEAGRASKEDQARARLLALKRLGQTAEQLMPASLHAGNAVLVGKPAEAILALARRNAIDLIVLTTKGRTGLARALTGSTAEQIARHAPCPVLSLRRH